MNLNEIDIHRVVRVMSGIVLVGTAALFAYELSKPEIVYATGSGQERKISAMAMPSEPAGSLYPLPALSEHYEKKVIYLGGLRKFSTPRWSSGKSYAAYSE